jgi:hypothetical protein
MSETHKEKHEVKLFASERNRVSKTLTKTMFGKKSPNSGLEFQFPATSAEALQNDPNEGKWYSWELIADVLNKWCRNASAGIFTDNWNAEKGELNVDAYLADIATIDAGQETLVDLQAEIDRYTDITVAIASKEDSTQEEEDQIQEYLVKYIKPLKAKHRAIKERHAAAAAKRKAAEVPAEA